MGNIKKNKKEPIPKFNKVKKRSLPLQIGVFYTILTLINISFFSTMILENQTDLLLVNFKYQSENLAKTVLNQIEKTKISPKEDLNYEKLKNSLLSYNLQNFKIFTDNGTLWHEYPKREEAPLRYVDKRILKMSKSLTNQSSLFRSPYLIELNESDFSLEVMIPLISTLKQSQVFLIAQLSIRTIQDRLLSIYYQVAGAIIWGIIFHALFAIFIFRLIFRRIEILKNTSNLMAEGKLDTRANWQKNPKKGYDELDLLGNSFNSMANSIQEKVETISLLNNQIQEELTIGKEVQELFLTSDEIIKSFQPTLFYRPLREVSGDIYRYYRFNNGYYGIFFADASGHGVSAALITVITLLTLQEIIVKKVPMEKLITELNRLLAIRLDTTYYATAFFMLFAPKGTLHAINAGHNTVFVLPKDSTEVKEIKSQGPPLGLMDESTYKFEKFKVNKGDKIFIYSDGLIETENGNKEQFGLERLLSCLNRMREDKNEAIHKTLEKEFLDFSRHYIDDVTFLLLEIP